MFLHDGFLSGMADFLPADECAYETWAEQLQADLWHQVRAVYGDTVQLNVLRALAIDGIACGAWSTVFSQLICEEGEWFFIKQSWFEQRQIPDLDWFTRTVASALSYLPWQPQWDSYRGCIIHYRGAPQYGCFLPPIFPVWLLDYGYTQSHYIQDLKRYWSEICPEFYQPWPGTLIGDISSVTTIRELGAQARHEIGALFDLASEHVESLEVCPDAEA